MRPPTSSKSSRRVIRQAPVTARKLRAIADGVGVAAEVAGEAVVGVAGEAVLEADADVLEAAVFAAAAGRRRRRPRACSEYMTIRSIQSGVATSMSSLSSSRCSPSLRTAPSVDLRREVEGPVEVDQAQRGRRRSRAARRAPPASVDVVDDDDDLVVLVGRALDDAAHAVADQHHRLVADLAHLAVGRDDDADQRLARCSAGSQVVDAGVGRRRARPGPGSRSARSAPGSPACRLRRPTAWPPRRRRRPRSRACASGRGPGARGATARARSVTFRTRSQSWEPSNSGSKPPTSSTSERRRTLRWQVYICVRIRSGDQSGLKNGPEWRPVGGRSCPRRCRRSRPRGCASERLVRRGRGRRGAARRRGRAGRRTRPAPSPGRRWRRRRCRRSRPGAATRIRGSLGAARARASRRTCGCGRAVVDQAELPVAEGLASGPTRSIVRRGRRPGSRRPA